MHLERDHRIAHDGLGNAPSVCLVNPPKAVHRSKLLGLRLGMALQLGALDFELALQELGLRRHRDVLTGGHRESTGDQSGEAGEQHHRGRRVGGGDPEDQRDVGEQAVADPENRRARGAALEVPMV